MLPVLFCRICFVCVTDFKKKAVIERTTGIGHLTITMKGWYLFTRKHDVISHKTGL